MIEAFRFLFITALSLILSFYSIFALTFRKVKKSLSKKVSRGLLISALICFIPITGCVIVFGVALTGAVFEETLARGPLFNAIKKDNFRKLSRNLIWKDIDATRYFSDGAHFINYSPLSYASYLNNEEMVEFLLEKGADPNATLDRGFGEYEDTTPLLFAINNGNLSIINMLLEQGADINKYDSVHNPLSLAIKHGDINLVRFLHEKGAENMYENLVQGESCIYLITQFNPDTEILNYVFEQGIDREINNTRGYNWDTFNHEDMTPFIKSVKLNNSNDYSFRLYELGADIFLEDQQGHNALYYARENGNSVMVNFLEKKGLK